MKIYLGADHQGFHMKEDMEKYLLKQGYDVEDVGDKVLDKDDDFPEFAHRAVIRVLASETSNAKAILICGGGQGMAMAANRFKGIRASVIWDAFEAKMTRNDNDSNVLCLPSRILENDAKEWQDIVETWLKTPFANAQRYKRRNRQIDELI
ncbi:RpiB/LacA/LacB family sugar-phosphate isomerase [Candidatus Saccharibacteria bacterium]|nr:RpiB/LacA/LacB family sugar-phosphate isomerase [Candidatus Saccharibacteria bacterium]